MNVNLIQGNDIYIEERADFNIIIDVIRAFTVSHIAFIKGIEKICLVNEVEKAMRIKEKDSSVLLSGEINGLLINGFDLDNSPHNFLKSEIEGKTLVQKTTNGVRATLNSLNAEKVLVTGLTNADNTVEYINKMVKEHGIEQPRINIIASHPTGDEDVACADYMIDKLVGRNNTSYNQAVKRILTADNAKKFLDKDNHLFSQEDLNICVSVIPSNFVMAIKQNTLIPTIERVLL